MSPTYSASTETCSKSELLHYLLAILFKQIYFPKITPNNAAYCSLVECARVCLPGLVLKDWYYNNKRKNFKTHMPRFSVSVWLRGSPGIRLPSLRTATPGTNMTQMAQTNNAFLVWTNTLIAQYAATVYPPGSASNHSQRKWEISRQSPMSVMQDRWGTNQFLSPWGDRIKTTCVSCG